MMRVLLYVLGGFICVTASGQGAVSLPTSQGPYHVVAADLDGDGHPDLLVPCRGDLLAPEEKRPGNDVMTVYLTGGTPDPHIRRDFKVGFGPYGTAVGDLDGDGIPDAVVPNFQANDSRHLSILWGSKDRERLFEPDSPITIKGSFSNDKSLRTDGKPMYPAPGLTVAAIADFNGDGRPDIVTAAWTSDFFVVLMNQGGRKFKQTVYPLLPGPRDVVVADFDGDGHLDLAFTIYSSNLVQVFRGDGRGRFKEWKHFNTEGHVPYHMRAGDVDRDGRIDLVVGNRGVSDNVVFFRNTGSGFKCAGSFPTDTPVLAESTTDEIRDVHLVDADGDGILDLFAACRLSDKVIFWKGTGDPAFGKAFVNPVVKSFLGKGPRGFAVLGDRIAISCYGGSEVILAPMSDWFGQVK
ncbi:MAG: FG-GAP repeat domain-containing protein [Armatimonadota bacterium]